MPRYLIERSFPDGLSIPMNDDGRKAVAGVVANNAARRYLGPLVRDAGPQEHLLHLRRAGARCDPQGR